MTVFESDLGDSTEASKDSVQDELDEEPVSVPS